MSKVPVPPPEMIFGLCPALTICRQFAEILQHLQRRRAPFVRRSATLQVLKDLGELRDKIVKAGHRPKIISGGGTGTFDIDPDAHVLTELQVGSYIFMDKQYNDVWKKPGDRVPFETSLFVQTTVVSANRPGLATTDAEFQVVCDGCRSADACLRRAGRCGLLLLR